MQIQQFSTPQQPQKLNSPTPPPPPPQQPEPQEKWDKVTFDSNTNTYHYERPGLHRSVQVTNPLKEGLTIAAVVGIPSAVGAAESAWLGGAASTALTVAVSPAAGALLGGSIGGYMGYKGSNDNLFYGGLAGLAGAGVGAIAWPLLKLPGVWGGPVGAAVAAGGLGVGVAIWSAVENSKKHEEARQAGYKPQ